MVCTMHEIDTIISPNTHRNIIHSHKVQPRHYQKPVFLLHPENSLLSHCMVLMCGRHPVLGSLLLQQVSICYLVHSFFTVCGIYIVTFIYFFLWRRLGPIFTWLSTIIYSHHCSTSIILRPSMLWSSF